LAVAAELTIRTAISLSGLELDSLPYQEWKSFIGHVDVSFANETPTRHTTIDGQQAVIFSKG
jgi:hypothetical protein